MKKVGISQSNYIPWKGYFDLINSVDVFIVLDSVQYTKSDWRNRNRIKTPSGGQWLTIPVKSHGKSRQSINEAVVLDQAWREKHWETINRYYSKTKHYKDYSSLLEDLYSVTTNRLSEINREFIAAICKSLNIKTKILSDTEFDLVDGKNSRILSLCKQVGANEYLSGPAASSYLDINRFQNEGIEISYISYSGYKEYKQLYPPFIHEVTVLDLLFNTGDDARSYMLT